MSLPKDKDTFESNKVESYSGFDKTLRQDSHDLNSGYEKSDIASDEQPTLTEQEAGDAALANSPWQYKLVALVTALLFPCKYLKI